MIDHQHELAHRLALTLRRVPTGTGVGGACQRAANRQFSALQACDVQDADDIEERLVSPFSLLLRCFCCPLSRLRLCLFPG